MGLKITEAGFETCFVFFAFTDSQLSWNCQIFIRAHNYTNRYFYLGHTFVLRLHRLSSSIIIHFHLRCTTMFNLKSLWRLSHSEFFREASLPLTTHGSISQSPWLQQVQTNSCACSYCFWHEAPWIRLNVTSFFSSFFCSYLIQRLQNRCIRPSCGHCPNPSNSQTYPPRVGLGIEGTPLSLQVPLWNRSMIQRTKYGQRLPVVTHVRAKHS